MHRITEDLLPDDLAELEKNHIRVAERSRSVFHKFIKEVIKVREKEDHAHDTKKKLMKSVNSGNITQLKKVVPTKDDFYPKAALKCLNGYVD